MFKKLFLAILISFTIIITGFAGPTYLNHFNKQLPFNRATNLGEAVLAASTEAPHFIFKVNVPSFFNENTQFAKDVDIQGGLTVQGRAIFNSSISLNNNNLDLGTGTLTASNVLYGLKAGNGITISSGQTPTIALTNTGGVTSLQSQTGNLTLTAGSGISIDGLKISATNTNTTQNIFKTISDGTNSISAGSDSDTLTLAAGNGLTITTDTSSKKFTFSTSGNGGVTGTGFTTDGIMYATGNSSITSLTPGNSGYILQSNGTGVTPSWVSASNVGTNYWQLNSGTLSPATLTNTLAIGTTNGLSNAGLDIEQNGLGNSILVANQKGSGDILTASASGVSKFSIANDGTVIVGTDGTIPGNVTIRAGQAGGSNVAGGNLYLAASNGTGLGGSGDIIFKTASSANSAITFDSGEGHNDGGGTVSSISWSHTTGSQSNMVLIVGVTIFGSTTNSVSSITYNGQALTFLGGTSCTGTNTCRGELWYLTNPASGSHTIVANLSSAGHILAGAATYYNVNTSSPIGTTTSASGSTTSNATSLTISSSTNQLVVDTLASDNTIGSPGAGQTKAWDNSYDALTYNSGSYKSAGSSSTTMTWTNNNADWAGVASTLNPAPATTPDTLADRLDITATGSIGIGTNAPLASTGLEIQKNTLGNAALVVDNSGGAGDLFTASSAGTPVFNIDKNGNTRLTGSLCIKATFTSSCAGSTAGTIYATNTTIQSADVAENYISSQILEPGDIIMPASDGDNQAVIKTTAAYQTQTIGIVSTKPGVTLNSDAQTDNTHPYLYAIALQGRVPVKVSTMNGIIHTGDLLTTSNLPGIAIKATQPGQIIGKALEDYTDNNTSHIGKIMVFVNISWADPAQFIQPLQVSPSAALSLSTENPVFGGNLMVSGKTTVTDLGVTGVVTDGLLAINGLDQSTGTPSATINTLSAPLKIQSLAINGTEFENGKVVIDTNGNVIIKANLTANNITTDKLNIATVTNSGLLNSSTGSVSIESGQDNIDVQTTALTTKSLIFLTPNLPVAVGYKIKNNNTFNIYLQDAIKQNLQINWWIIN